MQTPPILTAAAPVEVRPPWPDEMTRLRHFLPTAFLFEARPQGFVVVRGGAERIVAAAFLSTLEQSDGRRAGRLSLRVNADGAEYAALAAAPTRHALAAAWAAGGSSVFLAHTVAETSPAAAFWQDLGFRPESTTELYEVVSRRSWERMDRAHRLLCSHGLVPEEAEVLTMLPRLYAPVRAFLAAHMPGSIALIASENSSFKPEHSLVLLVAGEVKGVLLARRYGKRITFGMRLVAPELRGGIGWGNLLLIHRSLGSGLQSGQEFTRFELNPDTHADTRQLAVAIQAQLIERRVLFGIQCEKSVDAAAPVS